MPIYEYVCGGCGHPFEKRVSFSEADAPQTCPECGSERSKKKISLVARHSTAGRGATTLSSGAACAPAG